MKTGKFIPLGYVDNVKLGYGTVDYKNLKTIYIKLNSWLLPNDETIDYDYIISKTRRSIKSRIYELNNQHFKRESIVDLDIRTKGIKLEKKSFMNLEITLYSQKMFDIRTKEIKNLIKEISEKIIINDLNDTNLFNFYKNKD
jgi:hypothetical protein